MLMYFFLAGPRWDPEGTFDLHAPTILVDNPLADAASDPLLLPHNPLVLLVVCAFAHSRGGFPVCHQEVCRPAGKLNPTPL